MRKIEKIVFYLFIFCIPFQTRVILWKLSPKGDFNEWTSVFIYGTDLLILLLFLFWSLKKFPSLVKPDFADFSLIFFVAISGFSVLAAGNKSLSLYNFLKILEFLFLFYYFRFALKSLLKPAHVLILVIASGLFQSVLAIAQSFFQHSLGLKMLGESILKTNFNGVAVVLFGDEKFLRAYGTLPHPNILAAWLFVAIFAFYFWYLYEKKDRPLWTVFLIYVSTLLAFLLTFSRVIIGLWVVGLAIKLAFVSLKRKSYPISSIFKKRVFFLAAVSCLVVLVFSFLLWPQVSSRISLSEKDLAVSERIFYNKLAGAEAVSKPILGLGTGQFVRHMLASFNFDKNYLYQPVHNIYLLIAAETGFFGLAAFLAFVFFLIRHYTKKTKLKMLYQLSFLIFFSSILVIGLFDHFLWTIQQGQIMLWLALGLMAETGKDWHKTS
ncbi:MAG: O-antigen ligase family protein [Candidatus Yanofskybacteria bacterium]|nr:O-antigen ligase family protein [Candidatus Yanofskybacteria bacterium]